MLCRTVPSTDGCFPLKISHFQGKIRVNWGKNIHPYLVVGTVLQRIFLFLKRDLALNKKFAWTDGEMDNLFVQPSVEE